jgi:EAL domain-containing protein (putative c-di-GMP-specific phosphodiesterase class I)
MVQRLINTTKKPLEIRDNQLDVSVSIGVAQGFNNGSDKSLLDRAQFAQYNASRQAGSACMFYDDEKAQDARDEMSLKNDFYPALEKDQFFLQFQPVISLDDYTAVGAEALVRWQHPDRGCVSPGKFIPLAERTGKIIFLDRWVLDRAIRHAERFYDQISTDFTLSINLSAWQFRDDYLIEKLEDTLKSSSFPPDRLKIEITETSVMKDVDRTVEVLRGLKNTGVQIALDDFGTGHATFEYLSRFPIDELKIDRTFLNFDDVHTKQQQLVEIMIQTGERIGARVLAEGVETEEQLNYVRNRGCEFAQGFLFAKPMGTDEFEEILRDNRSLHMKESDVINV